MSIDENTGLITWVPQQADAGIVNVTVRAQNVAGINDQPFSITVGEQNDPPTFDNAGDVTVAEDSGPQSITDWATNMDDGDPELDQTLTFNVTQNTNEGLFAEGPAISETGVLTFTPADDAVGVANITVTLDDDGSPSASSEPVTFSITITGVNDAPEFTLSETEIIRDPDFSPVIIDVIPGNVPADEAGQTVVYSLSPDPGTIDFADLAISPISGTVTITASSSGGGGTQEFTVTADDNQSENNTFTQTFTLTVNGPVGIGDSEFAKSLSVFPIPGLDRVTLRMENDYLGAVQVKIFDMRGKMVKGFDQVKNAQQYQQQLNVGDMKSGTYFVHVILGKDIILERLLKN
ncbi:MAG: T9SS type A sorting domain-containing protein [Leptolyngbya sp. SIO1D8]|nr:T9SS type A sorting domain-containing protein [Leptolyngbya sp. SIO1D8]